MSSDQEPSPGDTQTPYRNALDAFAAADEAAKIKPQPGTQACFRWHALVQQAVSAIDAFLARKSKSRSAN
jgi:hypothetical protein